MANGLALPAGGITRAGPMLRLVGNAELAREAQAQGPPRAEPLIDGLSAYLTQLWEQAWQAKQPIQERILEDYRQRAGEYSPNKLRDIRAFGGSEIYMMLSNQKCRATEAWVRDVLVPADGTPAWAVSPTPVPDLDPDTFRGLIEQGMNEAYAVMQEMGVEPTQEMLQARVLELKEELEAQGERAAKEAAKRMERKIQDQLVEGHYALAFEEFLGDLATTLAAFLKGPIVRKRRALKWVKGQDGQHEPQVSEVFRYEYERRSPLDIFPAPDAGPDIQRSWLFDRHYLSIADLNAMRGLPGVNAATLDKVIDQYGKSGHQHLQTHDSERARIEGNRYARWPGYSTDMESREWWGEVPGFMLLEWQPGMAGVNPRETYSVNAWMTGQYCWKATLNDSPLGMKPYSKTSFEKVAGAFWGRGPSLIISDVQDQCNAIARALNNNVGMASGPMYAINDSERLDATTNITEIHPWKAWQFGPPEPGSNAGSLRPIEFFQPDMHASELMAVYEFYARMADQYLGMPQYPLQEMDTRGAGSTASGMSMAMGAASKGAKRVVANVDVDVIETLLQRQFTYNMLYEDDASLKQDAQVHARGTAALIEREQAQVRRQEFLMTTNNPTDQAIMGLEGRAANLREVAKGLDMPLEDLKLDERSVETKLMEMAQQQQMQAQMQAQQQQAQGGGNPSAGSGRPLQPDGTPKGGTDSRIV